MKTLRQWRDELAPGVYGWLGPDADLRVDPVLDLLLVSSPWGGFVVTRRAIEQGQEWQFEFMRQIRHLQVARDKAEKSAQANGGDSNIPDQGDPP